MLSVARTDARVGLVAGRREQKAAADGEVCTLVGSAVADSAVVEADSVVVDSVAAVGANCPPSSDRREE